MGEGMKMNCLANFAFYLLTAKDTKGITKDAKALQSAETQYLNISTSVTELPYLFPTFTEFVMHPPCRLKIVVVYSILN